MSVPSAWPQILDFFGTPLVIEPSTGQLNSDAGLLTVHQFDQRIGLTRAFAEALDAGTCLWAPGRVCGSPILWIGAATLRGGGV
jgi:hypothetical protein